MIKIITIYSNLSVQIESPIFQVDPNAKIEENSIRMHETRTPVNAAHYPVQNARYPEPNRFYPGQATGEMLMYPDNPYIVHRRNFYEPAPSWLSTLSSFFG